MQKQAILKFLKTRKEFVPAFRANSWIKVGKEHIWLGSEIGRRCRELVKAKKLIKDTVYKYDKNDVLRAYRAYRLKK